MTSSPESSNRPRVVDIAFWCLIGGAVIMLVGGLMSASTDYDALRSVISASFTDDEVRSFVTMRRYNGIGAAVAAVALAFLAGRARRGDARFRLAAMALVFAVFVVFGVLGVLAGVTTLVILAGLLPMLVGVVLLTRPAARDWYAEEGRS